jgi:hypothetical protein
MRRVATGVVIGIAVVVGAVLVGRAWPAGSSGWQSA